MDRATEIVGWSFGESLLEPGSPVAFGRRKASDVRAAAWVAVLEPGSPVVSRVRMLTSPGPSADRGLIISVGAVWAADATSVFRDVVLHAIGEIRSRSSTAGAGLWEPVDELATAFVRREFGPEDCAHTAGVASAAERRLLRAVGARSVDAADWCSMWTAYLVDAYCAYGSRAAYGLALEYLSTRPGAPAADPALWEVVVDDMERRFALLAPPS